MIKKNTKIFNPYEVYLLLNAISSFDKKNPDEFYYTLEYSKLSILKKLYYKILYKLDNIKIKFKKYYNIEISDVPETLLSLKEENEDNS